MTSMMIMSLLTISGTLTGTMPTQTADSGSVFYFHYKSQLYRSDNASITLLEGADLSAPVAATPQIVEVASAVRNVTTIFGSVWVGTIGWISPPLAEPTAIHGSVNFQVWLSSNDATPAFSGIGAGIDVLDQKNRTVGNYTYSYSYARGSILTAEAKEYVLSVDLNKEIASGQKLVFAVGVGSTSLGWRMKVYFDAPQYPSQVQLPSSILVVPEFTQTPIILTAVAAITVSLGLAQRHLRSRKHQQGPGDYSLDSVDLVC
jgi:hypothetical protein